MDSTQIVRNRPLKAVIGEPNSQEEGGPSSQPKSGQLPKKPKDLGQVQALDDRTLELVVGGDELVSGIASYFTQSTTHKWGS